MGQRLGRQGLPEPPKHVPGPPKVCRIMAFIAIIMGLGLLFYILLGSR